jgi:hypothetical protein
MKRTHDVKPKEGAVARALEDALAPLVEPASGVRAVRINVAANLSW